VFIVLYVVCVSGFSPICIFTFVSTPSQLKLYRLWCGEEQRAYVSD